MTSELVPLSAVTLTSPVNDSAPPPDWAFPGGGLAPARLPSFLPPEDEPLVPWMIVDSVLASSSALALAR